MIVCAALLVPMGSLAWAGQDLDGCALLSDADASTVLGAPAKSHGSLTTRTGECKGGDRSAMVTMFATMGKSSPVARFLNSKKEFEGIQKTPVSDVGDDAVFIMLRYSPVLNVRVKDSAFQVHVFGAHIPEEEILRLEKSLAQWVASKLM